MKQAILILAAASAFSVLSTARADVVCVQSKLLEMKFQPGPADGELGRRTHQAAEAWAGQAGVTMPPLTEDTSAAWCEALTGFAATPAAATIFADSRKSLTAKPDENTGFKGFSWIGDRKSYSYRQTGSPDDRPVAGAYMDRFEIHDGDCGRTGGYDQCAHDREHIGWNEEGSTPLRKEVWYSFSLMMPASPDMGEINTILAEFRPVGAGQINLSVEVQQQQLVLVVGSTTVEQDDDMEPPPVAKWKSLGRMMPGEWYDFIFRAVWSRGDDGYLLLTDGKGQVWLDFPGANTAFNKAVHMQYGLYRPFVGNHKGEVPTQIVYFDNVHKAGTEAGLQR